MTGPLTVGSLGSLRSDLSLGADLLLRTSHSFITDDTFQYLPQLAFAGIRCSILEDGLCEDVWYAANLERLSGIAQLGMLTPPRFNQFSRGAGSLSIHTRGLHVCDVMSVATIIGHNVGLADRDLRELRTIALTHDAMMPAGGDFIKLFDIAKLDEDARYGELLTREKFKAVMQRYHLRPEALMRGVQNEGVIGVILDVADKIAYTARDLASCLHHIQAGANRGQRGCIEIMRIIEREPHVCGLWQDVELCDERVVFADAGKLLNFLKLRALMFRELYWSCETRFGEFLLGNVCARTLYEEGVITPETLVQMRDFQLFGLIDQHFGASVVIESLTSDNITSCSFETIEAGEGYVRQLRAAGNPYCMLEDSRKALKLGDQFQVETRRGVMPLREAEQDALAEIRALADDRPMINVYYMTKPPRLSSSARARLEEALLKTT